MEKTRILRKVRRYGAFFVLISGVMLVLHTLNEARERKVDILFELQCCQNLPETLEVEVRNDFAPYTRVYRHIDETCQSVETVSSPLRKRHVSLRETLKLPPGDYALHIRAQYEKALSLIEKNLTVPQTYRKKIRIPCG